MHFQNSLGYILLQHAWATGPATAIFMRKV